MNQVFHPLARQELDEPVKTQQKGLGFAHFEEAERRFLALRTFPQRFAWVYKLYRRFPF